MDKTVICTVCALPYIAEKMKDNPSYLSIGITDEDRKELSEYISKHRNKE